MRTWIHLFGGAVALGAVALAPWVAGADSAEDARMKALEERLRAVEDRLVASEATVAAQRELLGSSSDADVAQGEGLDKFLSTLEIGGFATASYAYNFNDPDNNQGTNGLYQFNTDHNSFSLDAAKLELGRKASEPGMGGFQIDLLFGENANIMASGTPGATGRFYNPLWIDGNANDVIDAGELVSSRGPGDTDVFIQELYASYNLAGITLQLGKWETLLGFEVIDSWVNPNITQGILFTWAIPLYHTGILASGGLPEGLGLEPGFVWALGLSNGFNNVNDYGENKGLLARVGYVGSVFSLLANTFIGAEQTRTRLSTGGIVGDNDDYRKIFDVVFTVNATDSLMLWANGDWGREDFSSDVPGGVVVPPDDGTWYGVSAGAKLAFTDRTYVAVRGEFMRDEDSTRLPFLPGNEQVDAMSGTVTLGHKLTPNLIARMEARHDRFDGDSVPAGTVAGFAADDGDTDDHQNVGLVELSYVFD
jgi:hypothetical protein